MMCVKTPRRNMKHIFNLDLKPFAKSPGARCYGPCRALNAIVQLPVLRSPSCLRGTARPIVVARKDPHVTGRQLPPREVAHGWLS